MSQAGLGTMHTRSMPAGVGTDKKVEKRFTWGPRTSEGGRR